MAKKSDLYDYVDFLNSKYCKRSKNHFKVSRAYDGYSVVLTGKTNARTGRPLKGSMGSGRVDIGNQYHGTVAETIDGLAKADSRGWISSAVKYYDNN